MASYGKGGGYQDGWGKPITTISDNPVIVDAQGNRRPIVSYSTEHGVKGYIVAQRVEFHRRYDIHTNGLPDEYSRHEEWDDHSPRKVNGFFDKIHSEASRPTHPTLLSLPNLITKKPSWRSEDHDSPKYSGSPLRNKFEGLHLQDNRGSSPFKYNDGYDSPKSSHVKDNGINNIWGSPPRSRSTHEDWDSRRGHDDYVKSPYSNDKDDYAKPKFNGGYRTTSPPLSQATNDIGTAMKILGGGNRPLVSPTYAPQSHSPTSQRKESYPETSHNTPKETTDSNEARKRYPHLKPSSPAQMKYPRTLDSREAVKKYNGAFVP